MYMYRRALAGETNTFNARLVIPAFYIYQVTAPLGTAFPPEPLQDPPADDPDQQLAAFSLQTSSSSSSSSVIQSHAQSLAAGAALGAPTPLPLLPPMPPPPKPPLPSIPFPTQTLPAAAAAGSDVDLIPAAGPGGGSGTVGLLPAAGPGVLPKPGPGSGMLPKPPKPPARRSRGLMQVAAATPPPSPSLPPPAPFNASAAVLSLLQRSAVAWTTPRTRRSPAAARRGVFAAGPHHVGSDYVCMAGWALLAPRVLARLAAGDSELGSCSRLCDRLPDCQVR